MERKSIDPIALHFSGEKYIRPLRQFFTRSPFDEPPFWIPTKSSCLGRLGTGSGMLSVDDTIFVKKGLLKMSLQIKVQFSVNINVTDYNIKNI